QKSLRRLRSSKQVQLRPPSTQLAKAAIQSEKSKSRNECRCNTEELETLQRTLDQRTLECGYTGRAYVDADKFCENHLKQFAKLAARVAACFQDVRSFGTSEIKSVTLKRRRSVSDIDYYPHPLKRGPLAEISPWSMVGGLLQHDLLHRLKVAYG